MLRSYKAMKELYVKFSTVLTLKYQGATSEHSAVAYSLYHQYHFLQKPILVHLLPLFDYLLLQ